MSKKLRNTPIIHNIPSTLSLIKENIVILIIFFIVTFLLFGNSLQSEFAVVDDLAGYIENPQIRDLQGSLKTLKLQEIVYSLNYTFFTLNPLPLRLAALINHAVVACLLFLIVTRLYNKKVAFITAILFVVHPVNTEVINWISAQFYIVLTIFIYLSLLFALRFRDTGNKKYMYGILIFFGLALLLIRQPWVLVMPIAVAVFDYFFLEKKSNQSFYSILIVGTIILGALYGFLHFGSQVSGRMESRSSTNKVLQNQQSLIPIVQSYPYTVYNMVRLYSFPKDLTIYYDGNKLTNTTYVLMYSTFFLYVSAIIYFLFKNKRVAGILIMLIIFILPVFSPKKITWYITERYLYNGTGFFTLLIALSFIQLEKKLNWKYTAYVLTGLLVLMFSIRSYSRNLEWKTPETLALATISSSPYTVRPYNDLAGYYALSGNYVDAKKYYIQALNVSSSLTAIRNLGHIYIETGLDPAIQVVNRNEEDMYTEIKNLLQAEDYLQAMFYANEILALNPEHIDAWNRALEIYVLYNKIDTANSYLDNIFSRNLQNADTYFIKAYLAYGNGQIQQAQEYLNVVLEMEPNHSGALDMLNHL